MVKGAYPNQLHQFFGARSIFLRQKCKDCLLKYHSTTYSFENKVDVHCFFYLVFVLIRAMSS